MPIYEYVCNDCEKPFEKLIMSRSEKIICPKCGGRHHTMKYSVVAAPAKSNGAASSAGSGSSCACTPSTCGCR